jgi:hypothetical protein
VVVLRADPWSPEYGMGFDVGFEDPPVPRADPTVETRDWSHPISPSPAPTCPIWFVDGVRRVELRLVADESERRVPGLFGSFAVGTVRCDGTATFGEHRVDRAVVLGGGLMPPAVEVPVGSSSLSFRAATDPGSDADRPLWRLQQLMREAEGAMAARAAARDGCMVLVDGPLTFRDPTNAPVVGVVKRFSRQYLGPEEESLLGRLGPGQRTPLFALGDEEQPVQRYAWYARLSELRPPWHDHAGIVRCEVREGLGLERAVELAERVTATLPGFAGRPADPRTPQNLAPVAGLETWLRHRMGDRAMVRRSLIAWLTSKGDQDGG